jgi:hypothetical protein
MQLAGNTLGMAVTEVIFCTAVLAGYDHPVTLALNELACRLVGVAVLSRLPPVRHTPDR